MDDNLKEAEIRNMELWAYEIVYKFINEYKAGRPIFVHCAAGMQRSPAVIAMFLIAFYRMTADQAMAFIQSKRPIAFKPSANFENAIRGFEESLNRSIVHEKLSN